MYYNDNKTTSLHNKKSFFRINNSRKRRKKCVASNEATHEKRRASFAATQSYESNPKDANMEGAFLPKGKTHPRHLTRIRLRGNDILSQHQAENNQKMKKQGAERSLPVCGLYVQAMKNL